MSNLRISPNRWQFDSCREDDESYFGHLKSIAHIIPLGVRTKTALIQNAYGRCLYALDLKKEKEEEVEEVVEDVDELEEEEEEEEEEEDDDDEARKLLIRKIRTQAQVTRAAFLFREAALSIKVSSGDFGIRQDQLVTMTGNNDFATLEEHGGVGGLSIKLKTDLEKGINGDDADLQHRMQAFGSNTCPCKLPQSFLMSLWEALQNLTIIILIIAAIASLALGIKSEGIKEGWYDGCSIAFAVFLVIVVTGTSDYQHSLQFHNLNVKKQNIRMEVMRVGKRVEVSIFDLVVGDVVPLKTGDQVPADGVLISGHSLSVDESCTTGESKIVKKDSKRPFLMSGCQVADGYGTMLVTVVGKNTVRGLEMDSILEDAGEQTPLQVQLNSLATFVGIVGLAVALLVLLVPLIRYFAGLAKNPDKSIQFIKKKTSAGDAVEEVIKIVIVAVTIVVVAVPEGLPLAVSTTAAYSMWKMMSDKALVRRLSACETMGTVTTICTKTGTLTLNQMAVVDAYIGGQKVSSTNDRALLSATAESLIKEGVALNTAGSVFTSEGGEVEISGSPTEKALLLWGVKLGMNFDELRSQCKLLRVFPFDSEIKRGGIALQLPDSQVHIHWKGAAEIVLGSCTEYLDVGGACKKMDNSMATYFKSAISDMAAGSLRCVAVAYRSFEIDKVPMDEDSLAEWVIPEDELVLLAIVGIEDSCRPGIKEAVKLCTRAGVKVRMVTGYNLQTATAIALECGILGSVADAKEPNIIEGAAFRTLSESERGIVAGEISVMGSSYPNDKLLLVKALQRGGHVVAVTGDVSNDAPALKEADIGLAMGIQGTELAKESSDIIILDDNFASIVKVLRRGRSVYANVQKFILFQLTVNVGAIIINFVAATSSGNVPLNTVQLLWVNLIMDTFGALALATEPPTDHLMDRTPIGRKETLITNIMWRNFAVQVIYQVTVLLILNFKGLSILHLGNNKHDITEKNTLIFNAFVFCQLFNVFNARKPDKLNILCGVSKNRRLLVIVAVTLVLQVVIIIFLGKFTGTVRLSWQLWLTSIIIGFISWPLAVVGKFIPVGQNPLTKYSSTICLLILIIVVISYKNLSD
ncbi:calcium-transporting ATPase 10, plasma membrane-type-like [Papaver somniferum]|uniref:calcium-transporting ATPase 10, plasma membrane-type-like n=1 Tax=Papaver somniferum TaxID=3469 RepID=UPI000E6F9A4D|nr:calcium-transporting ATPase 10, plasma membrane-type-like [Papaver somniferum]